MPRQVRGNRAAARPRAREPGAFARCGLVSSMSVPLLSLRTGRSAVDALCPVLPVLCERKAGVRTIGHGEDAAVGVDGDNLAVGHQLL